LLDQQSVRGPSLGPWDPGTLARPAERAGAWQDVKTPIVINVFIFLQIFSPKSPDFDRLRCATRDSPPPVRGRGVRRGVSKRVEDGHRPARVHGHPLPFTHAGRSEAVHHQRQTSFFIIDDDSCGYRDIVCETSDFESEALDTNLPPALLPNCRAVFHGGPEGIQRNLGLTNPKTKDIFLYSRDFVIAGAFYYKINYRGI
jgi:hypothetical protein